MKLWDYCIVGGGVLGCAIGKTLLEMQPQANILIVEKNASVGQGNTIKSNAAYRNIFDTIVNVQLAGSSINYYKDMELQGHDFGRQEIGYLFLLSQTQYEQYRDKSILHIGRKISFFEFLKANGISFEILDQAALKAKWPILEIKPGLHGNEIAEMIGAEDIAYGLWGKECGNFSPDLVVRHYLHEYLNRGGEIRYETAVTAIKLGREDEKFERDYVPKVWEPSEVKALEVIGTDKGRDYIRAKKFVLATGAWINELLDPIGVRSQVKAKKRQLFTICDMGSFIRSTSFSPNHDVVPFIILPTGGVFLKPLQHANCVVIGTSDVIGRAFETTYYRNNIPNPEMDTPQAEDDFFTYNILPVLQSYFPRTFDHLPRTKGTAGFYAYSLDKYPVIDRPLPNLYFTSGASGSGIMKADSIARISAALISGEKKAVLYGGTTIAVKRFGLHGRDLPDETLVL